MSGDFSKLRFDSRKDFSGVRMQQGRVQLDADWNEAVDIADRRLRAETIDIIGRCVVPRETEDAFLIQPADNTFRIIRGRMYVDGLLAENHGAAPDQDQFDPVLEELRGTDEVTMLTQPNGRAERPANGPYLVFVDVWRREVTAVEDRDLIEPALGVDTTARSQTVWQVKALTGVGGGVTKDTAQNDPAWLAKINAKRGRLSTRATAPAAPANPCASDAVSGYRGLDNRLYRVEIHEKGGLGIASFKWSRDNASIASAVVEISTDRKTLTVERTERDADLRFSVGDWIEIQDTSREMAALPLPGLLRQIAGVDDAAATISFIDALATADFPTSNGRTDPARQTRVRRWDQRDSSTIRVPAGGGAVPLEHGIEVVFTAEAGAAFQVGDYWVFAARSSDGSVETLNQGAPRGIHHHYGLLAVMTAGNELQDCREKWPPAAQGSAGAGAGCCTVVCKPGDPLQGAIDSLPDTGGCVCLKTGTHTITEPLRVQKANVTLHGEAGAKIVGGGAGGLLIVRPASGSPVTNVSVEDLAFEATWDQTTQFFSFVDIARASDVAVRRCRMTLVNAPGAATGVTVYVGGRVTIEDCWIEGMSMAILIRESYAVEVARNVIMGAHTNTGIATGWCGVCAEDMLGRSRIDGNHINDYRSGIMLDDSASAAGSQIVRNRIFRSEQAKVQGGTFGIDVLAPECLVASNELTLSLPTHCAIRTGGRGSRVQHNRIRSTVQSGLKGVIDVAALAGVPVGVAVGGPAVWPDSFGGTRTLDLGAADYSTVTGNVFTGSMAAIKVALVVSTQPIETLPTHGVEILDNFVEEGQAGTPIAGIGIVNGRSAVIRGNRIRKALVAIAVKDGENISISHNIVQGGYLGILAQDETRATIDGNAVDDTEACGILCAEVTDAVLVRNRVVSCGRELVRAGISIQVARGTLSIDACEVRDSGVSLDGGAANGDTFGIVAIDVEECRVTGTRVVGYANPNERAGHRALSIEAAKAVDVLASTFYGVSGLHLVVVEGAKIQLRPGSSTVMPLLRIAFSNNRCVHRTPTPIANSSGVRLAGVRVIMMGNQVSTPAAVAVDTGQSGSVAAIGNTTSGQWVAAPEMKPAAFDDFNYRNVGN